MCFALPPLPCVLFAADDSGRADHFDLHLCSSSFSHLAFSLSPTSILAHIYTRTNFTQTAHKRHQCNHGNQGSSASGEGVVLRTLFCVASKMKPDRRSVRVAAKPTLCFSRLCVCVRVLLAWQQDSRQECRTGCRKKIPETVKSMPKTP